MNKYGGASLLILALGGILPSYAAEKIYIAHSTHVDFSLSKEKISDKTKQKIANSFNKRQNQTWFLFTPDTVTSYTWNNATTDEIKQNQVELNGVDYTLKTDNNGQLLRLTSKPDFTCGAFDCVATLELRQVDDNDPTLQKIKASFDEQQKAWQAHLTKERAQLAALTPKDFDGSIFSPAQNMAIKLPPTLHQSVRLRNAANTYYRRMGDQGLFITTEDKETKIYSFAELARTDADEFAELKIDGEIFIVKTAKNKEYLDRWLASQKGILTRTVDGAIYYNKQYRPEAVYFQYDDVSGRYFVARASAEDKSLTTVAQIWSVLNTMTTRYRAKN